MKTSAVLLGIAALLLAMSALFKKVPKTVGWVGWFYYLLGMVMIIIGR